MAKNINGSPMAENINGPPMAKNIFNSHYSQYLCSIQDEKGWQTKILENADKTTTKVMPRSSSLTLCLRLKNLCGNLHYFFDSSWNERKNSTENVDS